MTQMPHEEEHSTTTTMDDATREDSQEASYRPAEHFLELYGGGKDKKTKYLPVAHRVHWFNQDLPGSFEIRTEIVYHAPDKLVTVDVERWDQTQKRKIVTQVTKPGEVIVRATVIDHAHFKQATAHKYECVANFADALEKAETGAIGRALALLGYGTLAAELDEGRIVDSPVESGEGRNGMRLHAPTPPPPTPATRLLDKALAIPGVKRGLPPPPTVPTSSSNSNGKGGKPSPTTNTNGTVPPPAPAPSSVPHQKNGATPSASPAVPPPTNTPSGEEMRGALKDYELSVSSDIFVHFILSVCRQPARRAEWNMEQIYKELLVWQAGGEQQWRAGVTTPDLVEKLKKSMEVFPKASVAAFRARLPFLHQQQEEGKTFSDCTTEEVLSVLEMMREVSYLHELGAVYDVFVDPARKARISFHHLKTDYNVDHPLDLMAQGGQEEEEREGSGDPLAPGRGLFAYQKFLEGAYARKPDSFSADLCKRYANRLPALPVGEQAVAA